MDGLSQETWAVVQRLFKPEQQQEVGRLLVQECGNNLPFLENVDEIELERVRYAVLKLSGGKLDKLRSAVELAQSDWRDALMSAGFGNNLTAHKAWAKKVAK